MMIEFLKRTLTVWVVGVYGIVELGVSGWGIATYAVLIVACSTFDYGVGLMKGVSMAKECIDEIIND